MDSIEELVRLKSWHHLTSHFDPLIVARGLPFREGIATAYRMLFNDEYDDDLRDYAVRLLFAIRDHYR